MVEIDNKKINPSKKMIAGIKAKWLKAISGNNKSVLGLPVNGSTGTEIPLDSA